MRWFQGSNQAFRETAKMRLKLLLVSDKAGCSPEMILMIKDDVIHAISKYMEIEKDKVQIQMDTEGSPQKGRLPDTACASCQHTDSFHIEQGAILNMFWIMIQTF